MHMKVSDQSRGGSTAVLHMRDARARFQGGWFHSADTKWRPKQGRVLHHQVSNDVTGLREVQGYLYAYAGKGQLLGFA